MAQYGFTTLSETLALLPPNADVATIVNSLNDTIKKLNDTNNQLQDLLTNNTFKLEAEFSGSLTIAAGAGGTQYDLIHTIAHGLGYIPTVFAFGNYDAGGTPASTPVSNGSVFISQNFTNPDSGDQTWGARGLWYILADATNIYIGAQFPTQDSASPYNGDFLNYKVWAGRESAV